MTELNVAEKAKIVTDIEFTSLDGIVQWRPKFADGSVGLYANTDVGTDDKIGFLRKRIQLLDQHSLQSDEEKKALLRLRGHN